MAHSKTPTNTINTSDGITLRYIQSGAPSSPTLLFIPGWAQTAAQWRKQIDFFSSSYNIIAYDHRGQGESDKPSYGYRIARLASDLNDLVVGLDLENVTVIGHSMGCSVIWSFWDLFIESRKRISRIVLVDQSARMVADPSWTPEYSSSISASFQPATAFSLASGLRGPEAATTITALLRSMFTPAISEEDLQWTVKQNLKMSYENAATLLVEHAAQDWRDVLSRIDVPTLLIGAEKSLFTVEGMQFIAGRIPGAELRVFGKDEGGCHFMFWENPELFNKIVEEFLLKGR